MPWHEVCDPQKGYIKDDKIILEAYVKADAPCGEKEIIVDNIDSEEMEEEPQSQATVRFTMKNVSKVTERKFSHAVFIQNLPWKILAKPSGDFNYAWLPNKNLAVFLHCDAESKSFWSCHASAELRLIPQKIGVQPLTRNIDHIFYNKDRSWGTTCFMPWHEVCDPQKGYIKDDKIILEAYVKADTPRGMKEITLGNIFGEEIHEKIESVPEATIHFTVENFSEVKELERRYTNPIFIRNLPWKIVAKYEEDTKSQPPNKKTLGFYLKCDADSNSFWSCRASVKFRLIPQKAGVNIQ
ncbi:PREDICTED: ubiquitin carboxyl-terminal hydrolase 12-like [Branchiostoma belcheri]|uniref:Ubiquitin carboxyl-terminal hydrolase 12-like n=1 Tax=Branchiostoma belcheri TaxID=7741 RepID=A0A6P4Z1I3_BRABE|nr:PREDICTED: ubiquitin carboxyl-terminal hydrolase 12-like [Branchiostoma belcheri]